jgi:putative transport protein
MGDPTKEMLALFGVIGLGLTLGKLSWRGVSLGTSGVVFVALAAGHYGYPVPKIAGIVGVVLFVYCLGIGAGPSFLRMFFQQGKALAIVAVAMIGAAGIAAWLVARALSLTPDLAGGLFAGALTSTPALAAATERLPQSSEVAVGFGIAYPFGVVGVIVFVQLVPRLLASMRTTPEALRGETTANGPITRVLVKVTNPNMTGRRLSDIAIIARANCQVSRRLIDGKLQPIPADFRLELGQQVLVVGAAKRISEVIDVLGERSEETNYTLDVERQRRRVVVTSRNVVGHSLEQLHLLSRYGITVSRIVRQDIEFVPSPQEKLQFGDALTAVGEPASLDEFVAFAGHRERTLDETDLASLAAGLVLGVILGRVEITLGSNSISLGMAGGPLLVGLILGHLGHIGPVVGRIPRAARSLLSDAGLALFLSQAGSQAGGSFTSVLQQHGISLCIAAIVIMIVPMVVGLIVARYLMGLGPLETFGGICGAMTSTPGLGAVTASIDSSLPATSYATVYPLALILVTILAPILVTHL